VVEDVVHQADEDLAYDVNTSPWESSPSSPAMTVVDLATGTDVTSDVLTGSISASGDVITLKKFGNGNLVAGRTYRIKLTFTTTSGDWTAYIDVVIIR
jgi:hypothetical protein